MKRVLTAAGLMLLTATTLLYVATLTQKDDQEAARQDKKPGGGFVLISSLELLERQHEYKTHVSALVREIDRADQIRQGAQLEAETLRRQVAALEAEIAELKKPRREVGAQSGTFEASHYTAYCSEGCTGVTATGLNVSRTIYSPDGYRIVATDPRVIPLGTVLQITYADGTTFKAVAADTGGAIKGRKLDVLVRSRAEAYALGRVSVQVEILSK